MIVKFFRRGKEDGKAPIKYCLDASKERDRPPEVLAGDPELTRKLIDNCPHMWRYKSGVINFGSDTPSEEEQRAVMEDFERAAFAGLERDQYNILWVRHVHNGQTELHFVTPRMELTTGKSYNIAPPGHEKYYNLWRDAWNLEKGWQRPDDPKRAKLNRLTAGELKAKAAGKDKDKQKQKEEITEWLLMSMECGEIEGNREGIKKALMEYGAKITREGKDYISVNIDGNKIRLKGALYERSFEYRRYAAEDKTKQGRDEAEARRRKEEFHRRAEEAIKRRAEWNTERYKANEYERDGEIREEAYSKDRGIHEDGRNEDTGSNREAEESRGKGSSSRRRDSSSKGRDEEALRRDEKGYIRESAINKVIQQEMAGVLNGIDSYSPHTSNSINAMVRISDRQSDGSARENQSTERHRSDGSKGQRREEIFSVAERTDNGRVWSEHGGAGSIYCQEERTIGVNDGFGEIVDRAIRKADELIRRATESIKGLLKDTERLNREIKDTQRDTGNNINKCIRATRGIAEAITRNRELFKELTLKRQREQEELERQKKAELKRQQRSGRDDDEWER